MFRLIKKLGRLIFSFLLIIIIFKLGKDTGFFHKLLAREEIIDVEKIVSEASTNRTGLEDEITSKSAILIRLKDGEVIFDKNPDQKIFPASMTKVMSTIISIENMDKRTRRLMIDKVDLQNLKERGASMAGFEAYEEVAYKDLIYSSMLASGAEATLTLAKDNANNEENFVKMMNKKAEELGMKDTNFTNAIGLHDEEHYSSARDMATLLNYALKNDKFRKVFTSKEYRTERTNKHIFGKDIESTFFKKLGSDKLSNGKVLGGKTGFTSKAGLCLMTLAEKNGEEYILVTAGAEGNHQTDQFNIIDNFMIYSSAL